jgi:hypothetical protein
MKKFLPCSLSIHSCYWELFMFAHFNCLDYIIPLLQKALLSVAYIVVKVESFEILHLCSLWVQVEPAELSLDLAKMTSEMRNTPQVLFAREVARCAACSHTKLQEFGAFMFQHLLLLFGICVLECVKWTT